MEKFERNRTGIEGILSRLFKSSQSEKLDEEELEEEPYISDYEPNEDDIDETPEEEVNEEYEEEADDFDGEDLEKPDEEGDESYEIEDEELEESDDGLEIEYDELVADITSEILEIIETRLAPIEDKLNGVEDTQNMQNKALEKQLDEIEKSGKENIGLKKSLSDVNERLDNIQLRRKSVDNIKINEKFEDEPEEIHLSKSQKADNLAEMLQKGYRYVRPSDVTKAELGYRLSEQTERSLQNYIAEKGEK